MARKTTLIAVGVSACFGLGLLGGCNEVLDIQQAQLSSLAGSGNPPAAGGLSVHSSDCLTVQSTCSNCVTAACTAAELNGCVADNHCRGAMDGYNSCLSPSCTAQEDACFAPLAASNGAVPQCILGCKNACPTSAIFSTCQLYCGCMVDNCMQKFTDPSVPTDFASADDCLTKCLSFPPDIVDCRRSHCDLAGLFPMEDHCDHAVGIGICGLTQVGPRPTECRDKSLDTFGCQSNSECCSGFCDNTSTSNRTCKEQ